MELIKATLKDFQRLTEFYRDVIMYTEDMRIYGRWVYGEHPTDDMILGYIKSGSMYYCERDGIIVSAVGITLCQDEDYNDMLWSTSLKNNEVSVVHILCVNPKLQKQGIARETMELVIGLSRSLGKKAVRLDALSCNTPAQRLYESIGFKKMSCRRWYAENVGWADFFLYELVL